MYKRKKASEDWTVLSSRAVLPSDNYCIFIIAFVTSKLRVNLGGGKNIFFICLLMQLKKILLDPGVNVPSLDLQGICHTVCLQG